MIDYIRMERICKKNMYIICDLLILRLLYLFDFLYYMRMHINRQFHLLSAGVTERTIILHGSIMSLIFHCQGGRQVQGLLNGVP